MKLDTKFQEKLGQLFVAPTGQSELPGALLVDIEKIKVTAQPREYFDETALKDLENSIRELHIAGKGIGGTGILQPLLVRSATNIDDNGDGNSNGNLNGVREYLVTAGERRLRAAKAVGLKQVPVVLDESSTQEAWEYAIIENLLRADLAPLEEARALQTLIQSRGYSVREAAKRLGKDKGYLENRLFLLKAPEDVQSMVSARADTMRHAREISKISAAPARQKLIEAALRGASVLEIQVLVQNLLTPKQKADGQGLKGKKDLLDTDLLDKGDLSARADTQVLVALSQSIQQVKSTVENLAAETPVGESVNDNPPEKTIENIRQQFVRGLREQIEELQKLVTLIERPEG